MKVLSIVVAGLLLLPGAASAQRCQAPPGSAAVDQYCESIPGATGDRPTSSVRGGQAEDGGGQQLSANTADQLRAEGEDGDAIVELAERTAPAAGGDDGSAKGGAVRGTATTPGSESITNAVVSSMTSGGTMSGAFGTGFVLVAFAVGALWWLRFRGSGV